MKGVKFVKIISQILFLIFGVFFCVKSFPKEGFEVIAISNRVSFLIGTLLLLLYYILKNLIWCRILSRNKAEYDVWRMFLVRAIGEIGKYIPGKIWIYMFMIEKYKELEIEKTKVVKSSLFDLILQFASIGLLILFSLILYFCGLLEFVIITVLFICFYFKCLSSSRSFEIKLYKNVFHFNIKESFGLVLLYIGCFTVFLISYMLLSSSFQDVTMIYSDLESKYYGGVSYLASSFIAFFAFFAPGGLGVREFLQTFLLDRVGYGLAESISVVVLLRIVMIGIEVVMFLCSSFIYFYLFEKKPRV